MDRLLFARFFRASFSKGAKRSEESSEKILQDPSFRRFVIILIEEKNLRDYQKEETFDKHGRVHENQRKI